MQETIDLYNKGLKTLPNQFSDSPKGALVKAKNTIIDRPDVLETRNGFRWYTPNTAGFFSGLGEIGFDYKDTKMVIRDSFVSYDNGGGTFINSITDGFINRPSGVNRYKYTEANKNFYFTASSGIKKLTNANDTAIQSAGMPRGLDASGATSGASGFMTNNTQVAYRIVWGFNDANSNKILGAPSQRFIVGNTSGGTRDVAITSTIPSGITTSHFYQIYRSAMTAGIADEPTDELQLIVEKSPSGGEITAKIFTYTDQTPDSLRGATLYTSPSQQGILQANDQPPVAKDLCTYKDFVFYFNTVSKHRLTITLISVGGTGLVNGDTVTVSGVVYTGQAAENAAIGQFQIVTGGSPAQNIDGTARSLVKVINNYASNTTVYAYYVSGFQDLPGKFIVEERSLGSSSFVAISSRGAAFSPPLPSAGTTYASTNDTYPNGIYISKSKQPEAVPLTNFLFAGLSNKDIIRGITLREAVYVLKEDGVYRITGETLADMRVSLYDGTVNILAPDSAVVFDNKIYAFTDQGIVAISDGGVEIISRDIERDLFSLYTLSNSLFSQYSFSIPYESRRMIIFSTISTANDLTTTIQFVYNRATQAWTTWTKQMWFGWVSATDNKLYYSNGNASASSSISSPLPLGLYQELKNNDTFDYSDYSVPSVVTGFLILNYGYNEAMPVVCLLAPSSTYYGWKAVQFNGDGSVLTSGTVINPQSIGFIVDPLTCFFINGAGGFTIGQQIYFYKPIEVDLEYKVQSANNPGVVHHWQAYKPSFNQASFKSISANFKTDLSLDTDSFDLYPNNYGGYGIPLWGDGPWGGVNPDSQNISCYFPREKTRSQWISLGLSLNEALTKLSLNGVTVFYDAVSQRVRT